MSTTATAALTRADRVDLVELRQTLMRVVRRVCPAWLAAQREDVVQGALIRVIRALERLEADDDRPLAPAYLYKVAHSALVDEIRRVRRRGETNIDDEPAAVQMASGDDPEQAASGREIGRGIQACLGCMKRERRLAVTLYLQGHQVGEAATLLGWSVKRTENLVYRGLADLRACLRAKGLEP
jgi:RNA polymerase sigma-70 factor (ECF subfamily)